MKDLNIAIYDFVISRNSQKLFQNREMSLIIFGPPENCINLDNFAKIAHKIAKSRYFVNTENE